MGSIGDTVQMCKEWFERPWKIQVTHIFREQNALVDEIAKIAVKKICNWI